MVAKSFQPNLELRHNLTLRHDSCYQIFEELACKKGLEEFQEGRFCPPMKWAPSVGALSAFIFVNI